jgi:hypothetical protein
MGLSGKTVSAALTTTSFSIVSRPDRLEAPRREPWGGFEVALGWLSGGYCLAINTPWGGFEVALMWL